MVQLEVMPCLHNSRWHMVTWLNCWIKSEKKQAWVETAAFLFFSLLHQTTDILGNVIKHYVATNWDVPIHKTIYKCFSTHFRHVTYHRRLVNTVSLWIWMLLALSSLFQSEHTWAFFWKALTICVSWICNMKDFRVCVCVCVAMWCLLLLEWNRPVLNCDSAVLKIP